MKINIDKEVHSILGATPYKFPDRKVILHTKEKDITLTHISTLTVHRNFTFNITDEIFIDCNMLLGTYTHHVAKYVDDLTMTISSTKDRKKLYKKYKAVLITDVTNTHDSKLMATSEDTLNTQSMISISFELVDPITQPLKTKVFTGIFHNLTLDRFIKGIWADKFKDLLAYNKRIQYTINIFKLDNVKKYENIIIPKQTSCVQLPLTLQVGNYGLYKHGVGVYYTNNESTNDSVKYSFYVYPLTNYNRYKEESKMPKLLVINSTLTMVQKNNLNAYLDVDTFKVIATDVKEKDNSVSERFKRGTGNFIVKSNLTTDPALIAVTDKDIKVNLDDTTVMYGNKKDFNKIRYINQDENILRHQSAIEDAKGVNIAITLANTSIEFVYPGMPIKYVYVVGNKVIETTGTVNAIEGIENYINNTNTVVIFAKIEKRN